VFLQNSYNKYSFKDYQMQPKIDPLTGGLIFTNEEDEIKADYIKELLQKIKKQDDFNLNANFCP